MRREAPRGKSTWGQSAKLCLAELAKNGQLTLHTRKSRRPGPLLGATTIAGTQVLKPGFGVTPLILLWSGSTALCLFVVSWDDFIKFVSLNLCSLV